jgi:hypothetical protein
MLSLRKCVNAIKEYYNRIHADNNITTEYTITVSITDGQYDGTIGSQFVKIKGADGETEELECAADFDVTGQDVECKVESGKNIGEFECIVWRTTSTDGWSFNKVMNPMCHNINR